MRKFSTIYEMKLESGVEKLPLYRKGSCHLKAGESVDLGTYFNAFSLAKWLRYTTLDAVSLELRFQGTAHVTLYGGNAAGMQDIASAVATDGWSWQVSDEELATIGREAVLLGVRLEAQQNGGDVEFVGGRWCGSFALTRDIRIGAVICTYCREKYLRRNLDILERYCREHPWLDVMVIDNGQTLGEVHDSWLTILPNRNYGGSGGFTRGLIEQMDAGKNDYFLLMDDDIELETASLDRLIAICRHAKKERWMQMIGGAMLRMDQPTIQHENTAYGDRARLRPLGRGMDLADAANLVKNEQHHLPRGRYAAWWFCCIPRAVVQEQGYPLPVFLKGDDMEYAMRSGREIMTMDGIGVWHAAFAAKENPVVGYFNDRNRLILLALLPYGNRWRTLVAALARLANRIVHRDGAGILLYECVLQDYALGLENITSVGSDVFFQGIRAWQSPHGLVMSILCSIVGCVDVFLHDREIRDSYRRFVAEHLCDAVFWRRFLGIAPSP